MKHFLTKYVRHDGVLPRIFANVMAIVYTKGEERTNTYSHAAGILLGAGVGVWMLRMCYDCGNGWVQLGVWLYLAGMTASYVASTLYHAWPAGRAFKERLRRWDHAAIYWHIAGSYSPLTLIALRQQGYWGWTLFTIVWTCALVGTVMSLRRLKEHSNLETCTFVGMGLVILVAFKPLLQSVSLEVVGWILGEGVCYITGALFYSLHRRRYMHSVFHVFVLAGSLCHIVAVCNVLQGL